MLTVPALLAFLFGGFKGIWKWVPLGAAVVVAVLLKTFDAKFYGVVVMGVAVMILFPLPWLDHSPVKSIRYRPNWNKWFYAIFVINFFRSKKGGEPAPQNAWDAATLEWSIPSPPPVGWRTFCANLAWLWSKPETRPRQPRRSPGLCTAARLGPRSWGTTRQC